MEKIAIGFVRTSHGVRGLLKVESYSGETDHFKSLDSIELRFKGQKRIFSVERMEVHGKGLLMKLKGIDTPEAGKAYSRWEIWVDKDHAAKLYEGEFYHADLMGLKLMFNGKPVGLIKAVIENGPHDLLEVKVEGRKDNPLVPFMSEFIGDVDIEKGEIELLKDWILQ